MKGKDNNMNLVEQVRSLQVSARVFAAADDAEPYAHAFNCQNEKRVLWRDQQCFLCVHRLGTLLIAHTKWVFPALSKYRKKFILQWVFFSFFFFWEPSGFSKIVVEPYGRMF